MDTAVAPSQTAEQTAGQATGQDVAHEVAGLDTDDRDMPHVAAPTDEEIDREIALETDPDVDQDIDLEVDLLEVVQVQLVTAPVGGRDHHDARATITQLQACLVRLIDLQLVLKHVHWNLTGTNFVAVHQMLDPFTEQVRGFSDRLAERIAALGGSPDGRLRAVAERDGLAEHPHRRDACAAHLRALDERLERITAAHRTAARRLEPTDRVAADMLVSQLDQLEQMQWFVRSHLL